MKAKKLKKLDMINVALAFTAIFLLGMLVMNQYHIYRENKWYNPDNINDSNMTLTSKVFQYVNDTRAFYKYNISNVDKKLTVEELKEQGGVCWHWAEYYKDLGVKDGFAAKTITISIGNNTEHEIVILSTINEYCMIDQIDYWCGKLIGGNESAT